MRKFIILSTIVLLLSCNGKKPCEPKIVYKTIEVPKIVKCKIPKVPNADIVIPSDNATSVEILQALLHNYGELRKEIKLLREAIKVCE